MSKAKVVIVEDKKSSTNLIDITHLDPGSCDRARRVIEAVRALLGVASSNIEEDSAGGPGQVEEELLPEKLKH